VYLDDCGVHHGHFHVRLIAQSTEDTFKNPCTHPISKAPIDGIPIAEPSWQVTPGSAGAGYPENGFQEQARILTSTTRMRFQTQTTRLHLTPLPIRNNKPARIHANLLFWKFESQISRPVNPESQQTLERLALLFPPVIPRHEAQIVQAGWYSAADFALSRLASKASRSFKIMQYPVNPIKAEV
jgi:hypothetical protein